MVIGIVCQLEDMWWQVLLVRRGVAIFCGVLGEDLVAIAGNVLMRVEGNYSRRTDGCVYDLLRVTFAQTREDDVVRDWVERRKIGRIFVALVVERRLPIGRHQSDETPTRASSERKEVRDEKEGRERERKGLRTVQTRERGKGVCWVEAIRGRASKNSTARHGLLPPIGYYSCVNFSLFLSLFQHAFQLYHW